MRGKVSKMSEKDELVKKNPKPKAKTKAKKEDGFSR